MFSVTGKSGDLTVQIALIISAVFGTISVSRAASAAPVTSQEAAICKSAMDSPAPGTPEWGRIDAVNQACAHLGKRIIDDNPAFMAAQKAVEVSDPIYHSDPLREPRTMWAKKRGEFFKGMYTRGNGSKIDYQVYAPKKGTGPFPGVIVPCYSCNDGVDATGWHWVAESLAEAGYIVMMANSSDPAYDLSDPVKDNFDVVFHNAEQALDFFVSTRAAPTAQGDVFPLAGKLDRDHIGIAGHSGNGLTAYHLGHDPRISAVMAMDVADIFPPPGFKIRVDSYRNRLAPKPTLVTVADYDFAEGGVRPMPGRPVVDPRSKFGAYDRLVAQGADVMRIVNRSSTHADWSRGGTVTKAMLAKMPPAYQSTIKLGAQANSPFGEIVGAYYMLAWFDRYLKGPTNAVLGADALRRLASAQFDASADVHSIGTGFYDVAKARVGDPLSGNVPITIAGTPVSNLLSILYPSSYSLNGGTIQCESMQRGCAGK